MLGNAIPCNGSMDIFNHHFRNVIAADAADPRQLGCRFWIASLRVFVEARSADTDYGYSKV